MRADSSASLSVRRAARIVLKMQAIELPLPDPSLFKAYDIRGIVDRTLTQSAVRAIGAALGSLASESCGDHRWPSVAMAGFPDRLCAMR